MIVPSCRRESLVYLPVAGLEILLVIRTLGYLFLEDRFFSDGQVFGDCGKSWLEHEKKWCSGLGQGEGADLDVFAEASGDRLGGNLFAVGAEVVL